MTKYQVFRRTSIAEGTPVFQVVGEYEANDPKGAVRAAVLAMSDEDREKLTASTSFAACASSSWQELAPKVKVETAVTFA